MAAPEKRQVRVTLLGQPYTLLAQGDPGELERLAQDVDILMHDIAKRLPNADSTKIAVLTCLHLADRLDSLEKDLARLRQRIDRKTVEFAGLLDQVMEG